MSWAGKAEFTGRDQTERDMRDVGLYGAMNYQGGKFEKVGRVQDDEVNNSQGRFISGGGKEGERGRRAPEWKP